MVVAAFYAVFATTHVSHAADASRVRAKIVVDRVVLRVMEKYHIPGMEVGVVAGETSWVFNYGMASVETGKLVTKDTLFELGSASKP